MNSEGTFLPVLPGPLLPAIRNAETPEKSRKLELRKLYGDLTITGILERVISESPHAIILYSDFTHVASKPQISRKLKILQAEGRIFPFTHQAFVKGVKKDGFWIPVSTDIPALARETFKRLGFEGHVQVSGDQLTFWMNHEKKECMYMRFRRKILFRPEFRLENGKLSPRYRHMPRGKRKSRSQDAF